MAGGGVHRRHRVHCCLVIRRATALSQRYDQNLLQVVPRSATRPCICQLRNNLSIGWLLPPPSTQIPQRSCSWPPPPYLLVFRPEILDIKERFRSGCRHERRSPCEPDARSRN